MSFDWITVAAQIVNFLVLIWLLKRFLFRPVLDGIDAREAMIAARIASADEAREAAEKAGRAHAAASEEIAREKASLLEAARSEAAAERQRLQAEAERQIEAERGQWTRQMTEMRTAYAAELREAGGQTLLALTRAALRDLADADLEDRIAEQLGAQLGDLGAELKAAASRAPHAAAISRTPLSPSARETLEKAFEAAAGGVPLSFETDAEQSPGIVLQYGGGRISWTVDAYLDGLEDELAARFADGAAAPRAVP